MKGTITGIASLGLLRVLRMDLHFFKKSTVGRLSVGADHLPVLVVEGDRRKAVQLASILQQDGHRVRCVGSMKAANAAIRASRFEVLIVDLDEFEGDGLMLMRRVQAWHPVKAIALCSSSWETHLHSTNQRAGVVHVVSPVAPGRLREAVAEA
jgi:DNA-binding NtrC family response regulator